MTSGPEALFNGLTLQNKKPYTIKTTFIRVVNFIDWAIARGSVATVNSFKAFVEKNANLFKSAYVPETLHDDEAGARTKIHAIGDDRLQKLALNMLDGGLRSSEVLQASAHEEGTVIGKGNKKRNVFIKETVNVTGLTYKQLYNALKKVGLKPHTLRKLAATRASRNGARPEDICAIFGWSKFETASRYLQASKSEELKKLLK
jgi:integrase